MESLPEDGVSGGDHGTITARSRHDSAPMRSRSSRATISRRSRDHIVIWTARKQVTTGRTSGDHIAP